MVLSAKGKYTNTEGLPGTVNKIIDTIAGYTRTHLLSVVGGYCCQP